jgi:hypothetical protein
MIGALFVPLSECSHGGPKAATTPPPRTLVQKIFPQSDAQTDYNYGATRLGPSLNGLLTLTAFCWPLVLALLNRRVAGKRFAWLFYSLEILLAAGTIYWIWATTFGGTLLWGGYFVFALTTVYAIAAVIDLWQNLRGTRKPPS